MPEIPDDALPTAEETTAWVTASAMGDRTARGRLVDELYTELRRSASRFLRYDRESHTLSTTSLVHEAYLRLAAPSQLTIADRRHFVALASLAMRRLLVDYARRYRLRCEYVKPVEPVQLDQMMQGEGDPQHLLALEEALRALDGHDPRLSRLVELRFFTGLTMDEAANELGYSKRSAERAWVRARAFLQAFLAGQITPVEHAPL